MIGRGKLLRWLGDTLTLLLARNWESTGRLRIRFVQAYSPRLCPAYGAEAEEKKDAERARTVEPAKIRGDDAESRPVRRALSARRPHFADREQARAKSPACLELQ